jgi:predicted nucleic acid-binding protein
MRDFLIDTNIWEYWFNPKSEPEHSNVLKRVHELRQTCGDTQGAFRVWISAITWGEIECGYRTREDKEQSLEIEFRQFIRDISPKVFIVDRHVGREYGRIKASCFEKFSPGEKRSKKLRLKQLTDPISGEELGIDENDLWLVAQAVTRDMTLVSNDKLNRIGEAVGDSLHIVNWAKPADE